MELIHGGGTLSQCIHISNYHIVHFKYIMVYLINMPHKAG